MAAVSDFFSLGEFSSGCNSSFIALIPKFHDAKVVSDFRPISLIGSLYKIITKILANRLTLVISDLISDVQSAFVTSRKILDGPFILNELLSWCKHKKLKAMFFKVDFEKAFDSTRWDYLDDVLMMFGFGNKWRCWIRRCLKSARGKIMGVGVRAEEVSSVARQVGCSTFSSPFTHLRVKIRSDMSRINSWEEVISKVSLRLSKWKLNNLSIGGRLTLIKCVLNGSKRKLAMISWNKALASKKYGGLGISSFFAFNRALLFKWIWRFFSQGSYLWARFIKAIYGGRGAIDSFEYIARRSPWLNIVRETKALKNKGIDLLAFVVKSGKRGRYIFLNDIWLDDMALKHRYPRLYALESSKQVSISDKLSNTSLISSYRRNPRGGIEEDQQRSLQAQIDCVILVPMLDRWCWTYEASGKFSVKLVRSFIDNSLFPKEDLPIRWVKVIPIKVIIFASRVRLDSFPTRLKLSLRGVKIPSILCSLCNISAESTSHLLFSCLLARQLRSRFLRWWELEDIALDSYEYWLVWFNNVHLSKKLKELFEGVNYVMWWLIWRFKNLILFGDNHPRRELLFEDLTWCCNLNIQTTDDSQTTAISNIKLPILKKEEYDIWAMEMEHYLEYIDNEVWKVIQNGNSKKRISTGKDGIVRILSQVTAAEIQAVEKERKAKNILLMAILKEHMRRFHGMDDAKEIWKAIRTSTEGLEKGYDRFQQLLSQLEAHGAEVSTEDANHKFLRSLPAAWSNLAMTMRLIQKVALYLLMTCTINLLEFLSWNPMVASKTSSSAQNVAFVSQSKSNTNKVKSGFFMVPTKGFNSMIAIRMKKFYKKTGRRVRVDGKTPGTYDGKKKRDHFFNIKGSWEAWEELDGLATMDEGIIIGRHTEVEETNQCILWLSAKLMSKDDQEAQYLLSQAVKILESHLLKRYRRIGMKAVKEKEQLQKTLDTWKDSSKNLWRLINSGMSSNSKVGLGFEIQSNNEVLSYEEEINFSVFKCSKEDSVGKPLSNDESLYVYGKKGPQEPEPSVSDDRSSEFSTCQSNDSAGSIGTSSEHSVDLESEISRVPSEVYVPTPITTNKTGVSTTKSKEVEPSCVSHIKTPRQPIKDQATPKVNRKNWNAMMERELGEGYSFTKKKCFVCGSLSYLIKDCHYYEKKKAREAEVKRVVNTGNGMAKPVWTNANMVNHSNKLVPRSVQLNAGRPNTNSVRPNINTGRTNINSVRPRVNAVSSNVNTVRSR
ncbi:RNA-directed DNA polymerase, eukaryota, reverse transcriptase zinc-binding domain protein [Tanacetum coccineum]